MQANFEVSFVPFPPDRSADWRQFIVLAAGLIRKEIETQMETIIENQFRYRFVWYKPSIQDAQYGTFLFDESADAKSTEDMLKIMFPDYEIWLEDRDGNRVAIP